MTFFTYPLFALKNAIFWIFGWFWIFLPKFDFTVLLRKIYLQVSASWLNTAKRANKYRWRGKKGLPFFTYPLFALKNAIFTEFWPILKILAESWFHFFVKEKILKSISLKRANIPKRQSKNKFGLSLPTPFFRWKMHFRIFSKNVN